MMKIWKSKTPVILVSLVLALALLASGCGTTPTPTAKPGNDTPTAAVTPVAVTTELKGTAAPGEPASNSGISVSGQGSATVKPDVATMTMGVQTTGTDASKARAANDAAMAKVLDAIKGLGVADGDIQTTNYSIYPTYNDKGSQITGYTVNNSVSVRVKNLEKLGDVLAAANTAGANTAGGISFDVLDRSAAYNQALQSAMADAKTRAQAMADALGVKLGRVLTIGEASYSRGPTYQLAEAAGKSADAVPVSSGTMDVTATVSVIYEIVK